MYGVHTCAPVTVEQLKSLLSLLPSGEGEKLDCHVATLLAMTWHFWRLHSKIAVIAGVNGGKYIGLVGQAYQFAVIASGSEAIQSPS